MKIKYKYISILAFCLFFANNVLAEKSSEVVFFEKAAVTAGQVNTSVFGKFTVLNNDLKPHRIVRVTSSIGDAGLFRTEQVRDFFLNYKVNSFQVKPGVVTDLSQTKIKLLIQSVKSKLKNGEKIVLNLQFADGSSKAIDFVVN